MAGVFFAFSSVIMKALAWLRPEAGMAAMQAINLAVFNPWFMLVFMGTTAVGALLGVFSLFNRHEPSSAPLLVGSALYVLGSFGVTAAFNVPRNNALDAADVDTPHGQAVWQKFVPGWTRWNSVRTIASLLAAAAFVLALLRLRSPG
jgi:uncharacterized membrane protein